MLIFEIMLWVVFVVSFSSFNFQGNAWVVLQFQWLLSVKLSILGPFFVQLLKKYSAPRVKLMLQHMKEAGCPVSDNFIKAANCGGRYGGFYSSGQGIFICSDDMRFQDYVNQTIIHQLILAYDDCRAVNINRGKCAHQACSGIRAGHLSGDCHYTREFLRGMLGISNFRAHEPECVRRRVSTSLEANPDCAGTAAKDCMEAVWDVCYNDMKPFDKAP